jgi:ubiquinone/menaquinone biosynthesis C-methylase UbiE
MSFDTLAPHYRWMETILAGDKLHRCRTAFLDEVPPARNILLMGEGHGRSLVECRRRFPDARITCVDASARMLVQARRNLARHKLTADRAEFIHSDVLHWSPPAASSDLIVTNFFLDCFRAEQVAQVISQLATAATPDANWLLADFQIPRAGWKRLRSRLIIRSLYTFFRVMTRLPAKHLTPPDSFLEHAGFTLQRRAESEWGLLHSDWWRRQ